MLTHWLVLTLIAGLGTIGFNTFNRQTLKGGRDSTVYAWLFEIFRVLIFLPLLFFDYQVVWTWVSIRTFLLMGASELVAVYLFMKMHAHSELSLSSILSRLRIIWTPMVGFLFLGEILSLPQYVGIAVIFGGCLIALSGEMGGSRRGAIYALLFSLVNAFSNIFIKQATVFASSSMVTILYSLPAAIFIPLIMRSARKRISHNFLPILRPLFAASLFNSLTMFVLVSALALAPTGQVIGVFQGIAMLTVVSGVVFLHERDHLWRKLMAAIVTTIGIILLV